MEKKEFSKAEQLDLFSDLFGSQELVSSYIKSGREFCPEAQAKLFEFAPPVNEDLVLLYIEQKHRFNEEPEAKLFELPNPELVLETYCFGMQNMLQPIAQMCLLVAYDRFPQFVKRYIRAHRKTPYLCEAFIAEATKKGLMK